MSYVIPFLIAALMGMGVGGGGLFVIYLTLCMNLPQYVAQGTNLFFFIIAGFGALLLHIFKRKIFRWHIILMTLFGGAGSIITSFFLSEIDPSYARMTLGIILIIGGFYSLYNSLIKYIIKKLKKTLYK